MEIITKTAFENFEPWSGARGLWSIIAESGKIGAFEAFCEELWSGEDVEDVELNDLLWHDGDTVCEALWGRDESWILDHEGRIRNGEDPDEIEAEEEEEEEPEEEEESEED